MVGNYNRTQIKELKQSEIQIKFEDSIRIQKCVSKYFALSYLKDMQSQNWKTTS